MIDIRKLKELVRLMVENDLSELDLQDQQETVTIKRGPTGVPVITQAPVAAQAAAPAAAEAPSAAQADAPPAAADGLVPIESPMVGTFYAAPNPDADPFVKSGDRVSAGDVVCLVEAMKVFNEIKAETGGVIERVCAESGQAVEFGQALFMVKPA